MDPEATIKKLHNLSVEAEERPVCFKSFYSGKDAFGLASILV